MFEREAARFMLALLLLLRRSRHLYVELKRRALPGGLSRAASGLSRFALPPLQVRVPVLSASFLALVVTRQVQ